MSDSKTVKITNKRTGKVTSGLSARSMMQRGNEKPGTLVDPEGKNTERDQAGHAALVSDQPDRNPQPTNERASGKKSAKLEINSLSDFIVYAYSRKGKNLKKLSSGQIKAITKNARLSDRQFEELLVLSEGDRLLTVPRQVFFTVKELDVTPLVRQEVRRLIAEILKQHPLYQQKNLVPVIANLEDAPAPREALRTIAKLSKETLASLTGLEQPKPKDVETLRANAINCLALWLWESRGPQVDQVIRWLHDGYWSVFTPPDANPTERLRVLTDITDVHGVGAACQQFKAEADESVLRTTVLQEKIDSLCSEIEGLHRKIGVLEDTVRERDNRISALCQDLDDERAAHANSRAHLGDDREQLRSNMVRRLKREVSLLTEGLQALRRDPPKIRVMDDHAERVLEGLHAAIKELKEED